MCTRYYMELSPELKPYVDRALRSPLRDKMIAKLGRPLKTEGEIRPTDIAPVIAPDHSHNLTVFPMIWGFTNPHEGGQPWSTAGLKPQRTNPSGRNRGTDGDASFPAATILNGNITSPQTAGKRPDRNT